MSTQEDEIEELRKELQWVDAKGSYSTKDVSTVNKIFKILVPAGVLTTAGILGTGLYHMLQRDSRKQQLFMRYRVLAQGITVGIATLGVFHVKFAS